MKCIVRSMVLLSALSACIGLFGSVALSQEFQNVPIFLRASEILPRELLAGPNYTIRESVRNDGFTNTYEVETPYGHLRVESTALLLKRVAELKALMKIDELKGTSIYAEALKNTAMGPVRTAYGLATAPVETVKGIGTGIGNFFTKAADAITSSSPDKDSALNSVLGQASYKREYAYQFGVDPYTTFEPLQKALTDIAWTSAAGGLTVKAAFMAIPGGVGAVVGYSGTADTMATLVRDKTPPELEKINRASLNEMGVVDPMAGLFLSSTSFTPHEKTLLVGALASMAGVRDRGLFIHAAARDCEESVALFLRVRAQMMGLYSEKRGNIDRFVLAGGVPFLKTKDGVLVGIFAFDHVAWTAGLAQKEMEVSQTIAKMQGIRGKELWSSGTLDPGARRALENRGWRVEEKVGDRLLKK